MPDETSNVSVPASLAIDESAPSVIAPEIVFDPEPDTLRIAPAVEIPVPDTLNGSAIDNPVPETLTAPPELIVVPVDEAPKEAFADTTTVEPLDTVVKPVYVFAPDNDNVPDPETVRFVLPAITPPYVSVSPLPTLMRPAFVGPKVIPRFVDNERELVAVSIPPSSVIDVARNEFGALPRFESEEIEISPFEIVVVPE